MTVRSRVATRTRAVPAPQPITRTGSEVDTRVAILNSILASTHRKLNELQPIHGEAISADPRFYMHFGPWYFSHGSYRDHYELFVANLVTSSFEGHRDVGLALLSTLAPYQVWRIYNFIKTEMKKNIPRSMRKEIAYYLKEREDNIQFFDSAVLTARKYLRSLYAGLRIPHNERTQRILFNDDPPKGSILYGLKMITREDKPEKQAEMVVKYNIPYKTASTVMKQMTAPVLAALINQMTPQEAINSLKSLKERGAMDNPDLKALINEKLKKAKTAKNVSALKTDVAKKAANVDAETAQALDDIADRQIKKMGRIKEPTLLTIDGSGSMSTCIEAGKQTAAIISAIMDAPLYVEVFNTASVTIENKYSNDLAGWTKAFAGINAGGGTACGVSLQKYTKKFKEGKVPVITRIIMPTDEQEQAGPTFYDAYKEYAEVTGTKPSVFFIKITGNMGLSNKLEKDCDRLGAVHSELLFQGDYYSLQNLPALMTAPTTADLVSEIMDFPLPVRKSHKTQEQVNA